ncbi:MAG: response regulator transcription factor [Opitutaceae bacterium]|nr:response regulator transcription factor [Opitutaceae bacterium]MBP9913188.1 response regulator transcription factor [Opitutaceae bacterium]
MSKPSKPSIRVLLVDDSELVRTGLRTLLSAEPGLSIVGEAGNVAGAVDACQRTQPDVVLLDIRLPDGTGFDACRQILRRLPETRVLILTSVVDDTLVAEAIRAGTHGYLLKEINARGLVQAIIDVASGKSILDPAVTARVLQLVKTGQGNPTASLATLSPQEQRVVSCIAQGKTNKEAGNELGLSEKTVKNYLGNIFEKLHITRRSQAAALYAQENRDRS